MRSARLQVNRRDDCDRMGATRGARLRPNGLVALARLAVPSRRFPGARSGTPPLP
jgi:hypothetical protein